jgi:hypothetical protein
MARCAAGAIAARRGWAFDCPFVPCFPIRFGCLAIVDIPFNRRHSRPHAPFFSRPRTLGRLRKAGGDIYIRFLE